MLLSIIKLLITHFFGSKLSNLGLGAASPGEGVKVSGMIAYIMLLRSMRLILISFLIGVTLLALTVLMIFGVVSSTMNLMDISDQSRNIIYLCLSSGGLLIFALTLCKLFSEKRWVQIFKIEAAVNSITDQPKDSQSL